MKNYSGYETRALEVHDFVRIWDLDEVRRRLKFMVSNDMNALVLHEPGIIDKIVFPAKFMGGTSEGDSLFDIYQQIDEAIYYYALRENLNLYRRDYLKQLIHEAAEAGIAVYLEDKELWFKDFILKRSPELMKAGVFCPSDPIWWEEFLPSKYQELFIGLPELAGVVSSVGTGESRLAISNTFACECDRCKRLHPADWYRNIIAGMYQSFHKAQKKLVVRDFIYQKEEQEQFARALEQLPQEIVLSLKNTPHDFYPTFPDNPLIGGVGSREQWIEYDVHGQYFAWGLTPSIMTDDLRHRLRYGLEKGVRGYIMRTDWEGVQGLSCFDTPNLINLYGAAILGSKIHANVREIYTKWLTEERLVRDSISAAQLKTCVDWCVEVLEQTWPVVRSIAYVNGTVFTDNSAFHVNLKQPRWIAETHHSLKNWDAEAEDALSLTPTNVRRILGEKDTALQVANKLYEQVKGHNPGFDEHAYADLVRRFEFLRTYAEGFRLTTRIYIFAGLCENGGSKSSDLLQRPVEELLQQAVHELNAYKLRLEHAPYAYPEAVLVNPERLHCFLKDAESKMSRLLQHAH
jgi:hypothetical protein